eukprot:scaffold334_cov363-Pavlova_lutheri.AAC.3
MLCERARDEISSGVPSVRSEQSASDRQTDDAAREGTCSARRGLACRHEAACAHCGGGERDEGGRGRGAERRHVRALARRARRRGADDARGIPHRPPLRRCAAPAEDWSVGAQTVGERARSQRPSAHVQTRAYGWLPPTFGAAFQKGVGCRVSDAKQALPTFGPDVIPSSKP